MSVMVTSSLPWADYDDSSLCDLYEPTGTYIVYYLLCNYVHTYPSHWSWVVWKREYDWSGAATDTPVQKGRQMNRATAKEEAERWFKENVGEIG